MTRKGRKDDELRRVCEHLDYECNMLFLTSNALAGLTEKDVLLRNALLESFALHSRVLIDFLYADTYDKKPRADDVIAIDFFMDDTFVKARPSLTDNLKSVKTRADKEMAHLTYARLDVAPENKGWEFIKISSEILELIELFKQYAPIEKLK